MPIIRLADRGLRTYSMPMNFFNYLFFLVVYGSGLLAWLLLDPTLEEYRAYWLGLITLTPPELHPMTVLHIVLFDHLPHLSALYPLDTLHHTDPGLLLHPLGRRTESSRK